MLCSLPSTLPMGFWQLESSRRLVEIQELHQNVRAAAEEARRKEEIYKQLVRSTPGPQVAQSGWCMGLGGVPAVSLCRCLSWRPCPEMYPGWPIPSASWRLWATSGSRRKRSLRYASMAMEGGSYGQIFPKGRCM